MHSALPQVVTLITPQESRPAGDQSLGEWQVSGYEYRVSSIEMQADKTLIHPGVEFRNSQLASLPALAKIGAARYQVPGIRQRP